MSEQKATRQTVAEAMEAILARSETVTNEKIKEITGGSLDTIMRVRKELEEKKLATKDSPVSLTRYRLFCRAVYDDFLTERQPEMDALTGQIVQLIQERDAGRARERDLMAKLDSLRVKENELQNLLTSALTDSTTKSAKLEALMEELGRTKERLHRLELDLAGAPVERSKPVLSAPSRTHSTEEPLQRLQ